MAQIPRSLQGDLRSSGLGKIASLVAVFIRTPRPRKPNNLCIYETLLTGQLRKSLTTFRFIRLYTILCFQPFLTTLSTQYYTTLWSSVTRLNPHVEGVGLNLNGGPTVSLWCYSTKKKKILHSIYYMSGQVVFEYIVGDIRKYLK